MAQRLVCDHQVSGLVVDLDGQPLPGATVWVEALKQGAVSEIDGSFLLKELCLEKYILHVKFVGYDDEVITLDVASQEKLLIKLTPNVNVLHDVVIEGDHAQQHNLSQSVSVLSNEAINANRGKSLGEMVAQLPGVSVLMTGPTIFKPVIHGLHSQRILILNNGIRQDGQQWGIEHAPEIDPFIASEIEVVKGAETVRYGADAIGGVVIINAPPLTETGSIGGELNLGLMSNGRMGVFSGMLEGGFNKNQRWSWRLQSSVKKGGDFHAPDYNLSNTGVEELNFSGAIGYKKNDTKAEVYISSFNTELGILRSAHTGNLEDLQNSIENGEPWYVADFTYAIDNPRQKINHQLLKVSASKKIGSWGKLDFVYGGQLNKRKEYDIRRAGRNDKPALSLELFSNVIDVALEHSSGKLTGHVGINASFKNSNNVPGTGIDPLIPNYNQYTGGIFWIEKLRLRRWLFEAGVRFDHQYLQTLMYIDKTNLIKPEFNFNYASGTLGAAYYFNDRLRLSSNLGLATRPPHVSELYSNGLHHGTAAIEEGLMYRDGNLITDQTAIKNEFSKKWITTLQWAKQNVSMEFTAYSNWIDNFVYLRPYTTRLTIRGYFPVFHYQQTSAWLAGSDFSLNWQVTKEISYKVKGSYLYARDVSNRDVLPFMPPAQVENRLSYTWPAVGKLQNVYMGLSIPIVLRQYRAPITVYPEDVPEYDDDKIFDFMPAPDGYVLVNLEAGANVPVGKRQLTIGFSINNLGNVSYRNYMNRLRYYADDVGRNFSLRLKYDLHAH